jgi:TonB family protein
MIQANMLVAYSAQFLILTATAGLVAKALRLRDPRTKLWFFQAVLAAAVLLPLFERWMPQPISSGEVAATLSNWRTAPGSTAYSQVFTSKWLVIAVAVGALFRLTWLTVGLMRLRRLRRSALLISTHSSGAAVYASTRVTGPSTYGLLRPVVLIPDSLVGNEAVLRHELIHIARRDWLSRLAEELIKCALWFHPAVWWLTAEIELAREQVVDSETVCAVRDRSAYVKTLVEVASRRHPSRVTVAAAFSGSSPLRQRVETLLSEKRESRMRLLCSVVILVVCTSAAAWKSARALPLYSTDQESNGNGSSKPIRVPGEVQDKNVIKKVPPKYPPEAKAARIQGKVILDITISKEGHVTEVKPVSGPSELIQSAVDAVKQWEFRPTLLNGEPVEVSSDVLINYTLRK